jgi:GTPase SAR1 family protein
MVTLVRSQTFSAITIDGREYHLDLIYDDTIEKYLMRTDQIGMKIIREIHADRKAAVAFADSLLSLNSIYKNTLQECDKQVVLLVNDKLDLSRQLDLSDQMLNNEVKRNMIADRTIKELEGKAINGKIMTIAGSVAIGVGIAGILYAVLKN